MIGIPPFTGFFVKFFIFLESYRQGYFFLSILGLISGFFISILYLQILLQLVYDKPDIENAKFDYFKMPPTFAPTVKY